MKVKKQMDLTKEDIVGAVRALMPDIPADAVISFTRPRKNEDGEPRSVMRIVWTENVGDGE